MSTLLSLPTKSISVATFTDTILSPSVFSAIEVVALVRLYSSRVTMSLTPLQFQRELVGKNTVNLGSIYSQFLSRYDECLEYLVETHTIKCSSSFVHSCIRFWIYNGRARGP